MTGVARSLIEAIPMEEIVRIDVGYEGDWSGSVVTVWTRERGLLGFDGVPESHSDHIPSAELYFDGAWVGVHCYRIEGGRNVFDQEGAMDLVRHIEARVGR